jgi:hypothetical protein
MRLPEPNADRALANLARITGGRTDSDAPDWLDDGGARTTAWQPLWPDLLRLALVLLVVDVLLRRVRIGRAPVVRWWALGDQR